MPVEAALQSLAKQNGIDADGLHSLASNKKLCGLALQKIQNEGKSGGLMGIEIVDGLVIVKDEWTPQNVSSTFLPPFKMERVDWVVVELC